MLLTIIIYRTFKGEYCVFRSCDCRVYPLALQVLHTYILCGKT